MEEITDIELTRQDAALTARRDLARQGAALQCTRSIGAVRRRPSCDRLAKPRTRRDNFAIFLPRRITQRFPQVMAAGVALD
jgi:hypothetical protein